MSVQLVIDMPSVKEVTNPGLDPLKPGLVIPHWSKIVVWIDLCMYLLLFPALIGIMLVVGDPGLPADR